MFLIIMDDLSRPLVILFLVAISRGAWYPIFYDLQFSFAIILSARWSNWIYWRDRRCRWGWDWFVAIGNLAVFFRVMVISNVDRGLVVVDRGGYVGYFDSWIEGYILLAFILLSIFADRGGWNLMDNGFDYSLALKYIKEWVFKIIRCLWWKK